ncbi:hypothetical protein H8356DRAFT_1076859 [Neocallimastix lanati (nom. inval.)]|nr:hypothetical protein H8356DRAFT_1076859 [Neocallimastix sp. JGI-2020a]
MNNANDDNRSYDTYQSVLNNYGLNITDNNYLNESQANPKEPKTSATMTLTSSDEINSEIINNIKEEIKKEFDFDNSTVSEEINQNDIIKNYLDSVDNVTDVSSDDTPLKFSSSHLHSPNDYRNMNVTNTNYCDPSTNNPHLKSEISASIPPSVSSSNPNKNPPSSYYTSSYINYNTDNDTEISTNASNSKNIHHHQYHHQRSKQSSSLAYQKYYKNVISPPPSSSSSASPSSSPITSTIVINFSEEVKKNDMERYQKMRKNAFKELNMQQKKLDIVLKEKKNRLLQEINEVFDVEDNHIEHNLSTASSSSSSNGNKRRHNKNRNRGSYN